MSSCFVCGSDWHASQTAVELTCCLQLAIMLTHDILSKHLLIGYHAIGHNVSFVALMMEHGLLLSLGVGSTELLIWIEVVEHVLSLGVSSSFFIAKNASIGHVFHIVWLLSGILGKLSTMTRYSF